MGALATSKTTHISMVVPMTGYALSTAFCYYVLFDERYHQHQDSGTLEKTGGEHVERGEDGSGGSHENAEYRGDQAQATGGERHSERESEETARGDREEKDKIEEM